MRAPYFLVGFVISSVVGAQSPFTLSRLTPGEHAYELRAGGRSIGTLATTLSQANGEWTYTEVTTIPGRTTQTTRLRISGVGEMIEVKQDGTTPAGATSISVAYSRGRAKGSAATPSASGQITTVAIDTAVAPYAIDDNALQSLLPALPFAASGRSAVQIFSSGKGTSTEMILAVVGEERVAVPFGTFDTWKVEARGTPTVVFFVAKSPPYQLARMTVENSPLEMVLVR
jgi:hypothetical protein